MRWLYELLFASGLLALTSYMLFSVPPTTAFATVEIRKDAALSHALAMRMASDAQFLEALNDAVCACGSGDWARCSTFKQLVASYLEAQLGLAYLYRLAVYTYGEEVPTCLLCKPVTGKLLEVARGGDFPPTSSSTVYAVLPDGSKVKLVLWIGSP